MRAQSHLGYPVLKDCKTFVVGCICLLFIEEFYFCLSVFIFSNMASQNNGKIDVGDQSVGQTLSCNNARCSTANNETDAESRAEQPANRSGKTDSDGEISLSSKWITDVDRIEVSEEKRKRMMKKARAISRAISKKAARAMQNLPASSAEQSLAANDLSSSEIESHNDCIRAAAKSDLKQHDSGKFGWRIPRVQNVQTITDSVSAVGNQPSLVSKVSPPLTKDTSSGFGWHRRGHKTGHSREICGKTSHRPFTSRQILDSKSESALVGLLTSSQTLPVTSSQTVINNVSNEKPSGGFSVCSVGEVLTEVPAAETKTAESLIFSRDSVQNVLHIPSREVIEKIQSSSKQKSAILLQNAVPAHGERGTAVSIEVPSQKNVILNVNPAQTDSYLTTDHTSSLVVNTSVPSSPCVSPSQSNATKKRKLNISQYKSILPQRQKMLQQSASIPQPAKLPTVHVYGYYNDILHDHDYINERKYDIECNNEPSVESTLVLPKTTGTEDVTVKDDVPKIMDSAPATVEEVQDGKKSDVVTAVSDNNKTMGNLTHHVISSHLKSAALCSSAALERSQELAASKVSNSQTVTSTANVQSVLVNCMPAYFDVVSLPNRQTKISVSAATLVTKKRQNPQSVTNCCDVDCTLQTSEVHSEQTSKVHSDQISKVQSDNALHRENDTSHDVESCVSVSPRQGLDSDAVTVKSCCSSRSSSVSSAISISSGDVSSRSRSSSRRRSSRESSYSSDSWSENFGISLLLLSFAGWVWLKIPD